MSRRDFLKHLGFHQTKSPIAMSTEVTTPEEYTKSLEYLPDFMRDFHDAKDVFKTIQHLYRNNENLQKMPNGWCDNHVYVVDYFLWFMGQHGYKLQRVRKKGVKFYKMSDTIEKMLRDRGSELLKILQDNQQKQTNEH